MKLSEEHLLLRNTVRARMEEKDIKEMIGKYEKHDAEFAWEFLKATAELGLCGINIPEEYGGAGMDNLSGVIAMIEMSQIWSGGALILGVGNSLVSYPLLKFGAPHHKKKWLPDLAKGKILGCFGLTEPNHGSDAAHIETYSEPDANGWRVFGEKCFITNAPIAKFCVLFCRTDRSLKDHRGISAFLTPLENSGVLGSLYISLPRAKESLHAAHMGSLVFDHYLVPFGGLLGEYLKGFSVAMKTLEHGRNWIAAQAIGGLERALELVIQEAGNRLTFGMPIGSHSSIYKVAVDLAFTADCAKLLLFYSAHLEDQGKDFGPYASLAKLFASEELKTLKGKAQDAHGGSGFLLEREISRIVMDGDVYPIYEGTSNIQRGIILRAWLEDKLQVYPEPPLTYDFANFKDEAAMLDGKNALMKENQEDLFAIADIIPLVAVAHLFRTEFGNNWPKDFMNLKDPALFYDILSEKLAKRWPHKEKRRNAVLDKAVWEHLRKACLAGRQAVLT